MTLGNIDHVALAHMTAAKIAQMSTSQEKTAALKEMIEGADVFFGVLPPERGSHYIIVKGMRLLAEISARKVTRGVACAAILVSSEEEAVAMRQVFVADDDIPCH